MTDRLKTVYPPKTTLCGGGGGGGGGGEGGGCIMTWYLFDNLKQYYLKTNNGNN